MNLFVSTVPGGCHTSDFCPIIAVPYFHVLCWNRSLFQPSTWVLSVRHNFFNWQNINHSVSPDNNRCFCCHTFMIETHAVTGKHAVCLTVVNGEPVCVHLCAAVRRTRMKRTVLALRRR